MWLGTANALVIVQTVRNFVADDTKVARTKLEGHPREPGRRCIVVVARGDNNVVVFMAWEKVAKLADFEFVKNWKAVLAEGAEREGGGVVICRKAGRMLPSWRSDGILHCPRIPRAL